MWASLEILHFVTAAEKNRNQQKTMDRRHSPCGHRGSAGVRSEHKRSREERSGGGEDSKRGSSSRGERSSPGSPPPRVLSVRRQLYDRDFPLYKQPVEVGHFSLDAKRRFFSDARQLRYYVQPERCPNFDLRDGYRDRYVKRDEAVKEGLDHLLRWILANRSKLRGTPDQGGTASPAFNSRLDVDFVTWRGHLTKLLTTPYETREGWLLAVSQLSGTLYVSEVETEAARQSRESRTERHEEMMFWGYRFEQYCCADKPGGRPAPRGVVNTNEAYCTVVRTRLAGHRLLFSGEVDCRDESPLSPPAPGCYIELKTSAEICTPKQRSNFHRFKLLKWWAQSFLPAVPRIVAGFRDDNGVVVSVETFHTSKISQLIKSEPNCWKPTVCMNFCCDFLSFVKTVVAEDDPRVVYLFSWEPYRDVTYSVHRDSEYSFLPDWYVKEMTNTDLL
ncbi:decapping and exoribonuclease protein isoform X3 [Lepisosteus oculatus]|uniref:decapping and exoribonuclease protein isoform X3 n=1 Tax=Lepisosteus oculatus TaxID=7918 RepID=UPI0035F50BFE